MWRRIVSSNLKTLAAADFAAASSRPLVVRSPVCLHLTANRSAISASSSVFPRHFSSESAATSVKKKVEDVMPIATGHEREEIEADLEGRRILDIDFPEGPFGTKNIDITLVPVFITSGTLTEFVSVDQESPAVVKSYYDKRIIGCPGGEGEDEHDVVWFWLEKGKSFECPVCSQYFKLEVVGPGGPPDGHGDDEDHHH